MAISKQKRDKICITCNTTYFKHKRRSFKSFDLSRFCSPYCRRTSKETRDKMRLAHIGKKYKPMSIQGKINVGKAKRGIKQSQETIKKRIESNKGFKHTEETKKKLSILRSGTGNGMYGKIPKNYKGGYENQLLLNRMRRARVKNSIGSFTLEQWVDLKKKFNYMCLCCKRSEPEIKLASDHIMPLVKGGSNDISNIQPLCKSCNSRKYNKYIDFISNFQIKQYGTN